MKVKNSRRLGEIAIAEGVLNAAKLDECLGAQQIIIGLGCSKKLGEVMVDKGLVTVGGLDRLLRLQRERHQVRTLGNYELGAKLGKGGTGDVVRATRQSDGSQVALKFLSRDSESKPTFVERFEREARLAATLFHPNLVRTHGVEQLGQHRVLVMEFIDGSTLQRLIKADGRLGESVALRITFQLAQALAYLGSKRIVHRDIKPGNVMIDRDGNAKLLDLGLARHEMDDNPITMTGQVIGTPDFMAPEQITGKALDTRTDVYALGATLYMMTTGVTPYAGRGDQQAILMGHLSGSYADPRGLAPELSEGAARVIAKAMATSPEQRYQDMESLARDLELVMRGQAMESATSVAIALPPPAMTSRAELSRRCRVCGAEPAPEATRCARCGEELGDLTRTLAGVPRTGPSSSVRSRASSAPRRAKTSLMTPHAGGTRAAGNAKRNLSLVVVVATCAAGIGYAIGHDRTEPMTAQVGDSPSPDDPPPAKLVQSKPSLPSRGAATSTYESQLANAERLLRGGDARGALSSIDVAATLGTLDAAANVLRGEAYLALNKPAEARAPFRRATELDPTRSSAWRMLGESYLRCADRNAALTSFKRALAASASDEEQVRLRAQIVALESLENEAPPDPPAQPPDPPVIPPDQTPAKPDPPVTAPDPPPTKPDPPIAVCAAAVGPAPRPGKATVPFFGLQIDGSRVAFVVDKSATLRPVVEQLRAELTTAIEGLDAAQEFSIVLFDAAPRLFSRDLRPATLRFKALAKRFVAGIEANGESNPDDAIAAMLEIERLDAIVVVTNGRLSPRAIESLTRALDLGVGGPRVYLVDGAALVRAKVGGAGARDPKLEVLMAKVAKQR